MDRAQEHGRPWPARLLVVCAVLTGLFLMHGTPTAAADGCHAPMPASASPSAAMPAAQASMAQASPVQASLAQASLAQASLARAQPAHGVMAAQAEDRTGTSATGPLRVVPGGMHGSLCVSTPAHTSPVPVAAGHGAVVVPFAQERPGRTWAAGGPWWRGPPGGGRGILLRVCVART